MKTFAALLLLCALPAGAVVDDSDLAGPPPARQAERLAVEALNAPQEEVFALESSAPTPAADAVVRVRLLLAARDGSRRAARLAKARLIGPGAPQDWTAADENGRLALPVAGLSGTYRVRFSLDNAYWRFETADGASYEWESAPFSFSSGGVDLGDVSPAAGSENAKLGLLHLTYLDALDFLKREGDADWWQKPLTIRWPGDGDFFSPENWSLTLSNAEAWDVVLHELGHAVMYGSMDVEGAGGAHKIDECYSQQLAWSEGWATFFAAAVRLDRAAADPRFEFLVPRRAPIRIENVPEDVCQGPDSEWRVAAGLWDLLDTHPDGLDRFSMPFGEIFKAARSGHTDGVASFWNLLAKRLDGGERRAAEEALAQNTLVQARPPLRAPLPRAPAAWAAAVVLP